jgi:thiol-disulfide isomerase/thioredoxin
MIKLFLNVLYALRVVLVTGMILLITVQAIAQHYPEIGKPFPNYTINNVQNYRSSTISINELRGRHVILEFWNKYCSACFVALPKASEFSIKYGDKLSLIAIGAQDDEQRIQVLYEKINERFKLNMTVAFDSALFNRVVPLGVPHLVWIDRQGIVKAITSGEELTHLNVQHFLSDEPFLFRDYSAKATAKGRQGYDRRKPFLIDGNGGGAMDFSYRSVLAQYKLGMPTSGLVKNITSAVRESGVQGCATLTELYLLAYTGYSVWTDEDPVYSRFSPHIILQLKDTSGFSFDYTTGKGVYWYSQIVPLYKATPEYLMRVMQNDLENYFEYDVQIEERDVPCWILTSTRQSRAALKSKSTDQSRDYLEQIGLKLTNVPIKHAMHNIFYKHLIGQIPIVDETGIISNIDIELEAYLDSIPDIQKKLREKGLILTRGKRPMRVIVIRDRTLQ